MPSNFAPVHHYNISSHWNPAEITCVNRDLAFQRAEHSPSQSTSAVLPPAIPHAQATVNAWFPAFLFRVSFEIALEPGLQTQMNAVDCSV